MRLDDNWDVSLPDSGMVLSVILKILGKILKTEKILGKTLTTTQEYLSTILKYPRFSVRLKVGDISIIVFLSVGVTSSKWK